jgi:membrane-associated protein
MSVIHQLVDLVVHLNKHLDYVCVNYGAWVYLLLFLIVFCETGLVVTPFLPGDVLVFTVGALAARGTLDLWISALVLIVAGALGGFSNYTIGYHVGARFFTDDARILKKRYLDQTHEFFEKHGPKAVILARFLPLLRTFVPFVAGMGAMTPKRFFFYNLIGAALWIVLVLAAGWFFGGLPFVRDHFEVVVVGIIVVSMLPVALEAAARVWKKKA